VQALPSVSEREERRAHLPQWLLKDEEKNGPGAFDWTYNGQPIKNSEGNQVLAKRQRVRVKLKVCKACNDELATRFEGTTKNILRELFATGGGVCLESQEARLVGEWFAKTMLLLAHPDRYHDNPVITRNSVRLPDDEVPGQHFYEWLINGQSPPGGLVDLAAPGRPHFAETTELLRAATDGNCGPTNDGVYRIPMGPSWHLGRLGRSPRLANHPSACRARVRSAGTARPDRCR
jgi:hypothetical protein